MADSPAPSPGTAPRIVLRPTDLLLIVGAYASAVFLPFLGSGRVLTSHEVMIAQPALQILEGYDWIVPYYAHERWLDKPPLINWLAAFAFYLLGGFSEWAARLPAALSAIGLCLVVTAAAARCFGNLAGLFAGLVQATCVYMFMQGRLGEIDMPLALLVSAAQALLLNYWGAGRFRLPIGAACAVHALLGLAVLAKGPLAVILVGFGTLLFCAFRRSLAPLRGLVLTPGLACFVLVVVPWHVAALYEVGDEALEQWGYNYLLRFGGQFHLAPKTFLLYFYSIPWLTLPWFLALLIEVPRLWREARQGDALRQHFLWSWFLGGLLFLQLSSFKNEHYTIPILPPLSILCGQLMVRHAGYFGRRALPVYLSLFGGILATYLIVGGLIMPQRDHRRAGVEFVRDAVGALPADASIYVIAHGQSSIYPYIPRQCTFVGSAAEIQAAYLAGGGAPLYVLTLHAYQPHAEAFGLRLADVRVEPPRKRLEDGKRLVLATVVGLHAPASTAPATSRP